MSDALHLDTPTERITYPELDPEHQERLLNELRERRLSLTRVYEDLVAKKRAALNVKLGEKAGKLAERIRKKLEAADKAITAVEDDLKTVKAIMIELESEA